MAIETRLDRVCNNWYPHCVLNIIIAVYADLNVLSIAFQIENLIDMKLFVAQCFFK